MYTFVACFKNDSCATATAVVRGFIVLLIT